ncbi:hypothetical protein J4456_01290 [Candidatus Pacearchaeota archaeon]|nr:hypothetical protein [Candidatus Pacearchaeota archaeon]
MKGTLKIVKLGRIQPTIHGREFIPEVVITYENGVRRLNGKCIIQRPQNSRQLTRLIEDIACANEGTENLDERVDYGIRDILYFSPYRINQQKRGNS